MSQRLEHAIACLSSALTESNEALCEKLETNNESLESLCEKVEDLIEAVGEQVNKTPIVGDACCVLIDGVAGYASPIRIFDGETGTLSEEASWVDPDTLAPITGTVEAADPCDCDCLDCGTEEAVKTVVTSDVNGTDATVIFDSAVDFASGDSITFTTVGGETVTGTVNTAEGTKASISNLSVANANLVGATAKRSAVAKKG